MADPCELLLERLKDFSEDEINAVVHSLHLHHRKIYHRHEEEDCELCIYYPAEDCEMCERSVDGRQCEDESLLKQIDRLEILEFYELIRKLRLEHAKSLTHRPESCELCVEEGEHRYCYVCKSASSMEDSSPESICVMCNQTFHFCDDNCQLHWIQVWNCECGERLQDDDDFDECPGICNDCAEKSGPLISCPGKNRYGCIEVLENQCYKPMVKRAKC